jgi:hypothetical protein
MSVYNTQRTITLNTKGSLSGPYYRVEFSNDCINYYTSSYTASINPVYLNGHDGSASYSSTVYASMSIVNLPTVGSTASILVPNNASCIKLINLSNSCDGNEYIENISSTTTSTSTSTTSTSTTSTSTTTSTTTTSTTTSTTTAAPSANLAWSYSETGGANAEMRIYVNGSVVETRTNTSSGTYTGLVAGDTIYVELELLSSCSAPDNKGNLYTSSNRGTLVDADCFTSSTGTFTTPTYTVVAGDVGTTITLDTFANCDSACI